MYPNTISNNKKYDGIMTICRRPTVKKSRGKEYPSIDVRCTDIQDILNHAAKFNMCAVFLYTVKNRNYFMKIEPSFSQRVTVSCKYGQPFTVANVKALVKNDDPYYSIPI